MDTQSFAAGEIVFGQGDFIFRKILEDFKKSSFIGIMTYNIFADDDSILLKELEEPCKRNTKVVLITNIPRRFNSYTSEHAAIAAKKAIDAYIKQLNPRKYGATMSVYFKDDNHAKVIVTDNLVYWGSGNYSDKSCSNFECGTFSSDPALIAYVKDVIFPEIIDESISYFTFELTEVIQDLEKAQKFCLATIESIFHSTHFPWADFESSFQEQWTFNSSEFGISSSMLNNYVGKFYSFEDALKSIPEIIDSANHSESEAKTELENLYKGYIHSFHKMKQDVEAFSKSVSTVMKFNPNDRALKIIEIEYGMEAYDDALDHYSELAMQQAQTEYTQLINAVEPAVMAIMAELENMAKFFEQMKQRLQNLVYVNPEIDNTGIK